MRAQDFQATEASDEEVSEESSYDIDNATDDDGNFITDDESEGAYPVQRHNVFRDSYVDGDNDRAFYQRPTYEHYADEDSDQIAGLWESDPPIYRVPVKRGRHAICVLSALRVITLNAYHERLPPELRPPAVRPYDVRSVFYNPNDPSCIYVEADSIQTVERLLLHQDIRGYVQRFTPSRGSSQRTRRKSSVAPPPLVSVRKDRATLLTYVPDRKRLHQGELCSIRRGSRVYLGDPCCVISVEGETARVAVRPRIHSLLGDQPPSRDCAPRRITREEALEAYRGIQEGSYEREVDFQLGQQYVLLLEGYEIIQLAASNLRPLKGEELRAAVDLFTIASLQIGSKAGQRIVQARLDLERKRPLNVGDVVYLTNYRPDAGLNMAECRVVRRPASTIADDSYTVQLLGKAYAAYEPLIVPRAQLIRAFGQGNRVRVADGTYKGVTGEIVSQEITQDRKYIRVCIRTDLFEEEIGTIDEDAPGVAITTDEVESTNTCWAGLAELVLPNGVQLRPERMVRLIQPADDALILHVSHDSVIVLTATNHRLCTRHANLEVLSLKACDQKTTSDRNGKTIGKGSRIRVANDSELVEHVLEEGTIVALGHHSVSTLFVKPLATAMVRDIFVIDAKYCDRVFPGKIVEGALRRRSREQAQSEMHIGQRVQILDPIFPGGIGILLEVDAQGMTTVKCAERSYRVNITRLALLDKRPAPTLDSSARMLQDFGSFPTRSQQFGGFGFNPKSSLRDEQPKEEEPDDDLGRLGYEYADMD